MPTRAPDSPGLSQAPGVGHLLVGEPVSLLLAGVDVCLFPGRWWPSGGSRGNARPPRISQSLNTPTGQRICIQNTEQKLLGSCRKGEAESCGGGLENTGGMRSLL